MRDKRGSVEIIFITFFVIFMFIILATFYILYVQINSYIYPIKQDIFYIAQNAYFSLDNKDLSYYKYTVNQEELYEKVKTLTYSNHDNIEISKLDYNSDTNTLTVEFNIKVKPMMLSGIIKDFKLKIKEEVKLKSMEVK